MTPGRGSVRARNACVRAGSGVVSPREQESLAEVGVREGIRAEPVHVGLDAGIDAQGNRGRKAISPIAAAGSGIFIVRWVSSISS